MLVRIVPVEIRDALLESKEIVNRADDDVDSGRVASLRLEVVLKVSVVALAEKLEESEETLCEEMGWGESYRELQRRRKWTENTTQLLI